MGRFGSTDASVSLGRITARVTAEHPSFLCDYVQSKKTHRPGISSLLLTLGLCSVAFRFTILYLLPRTRDGRSPRVTARVTVATVSPIYRFGSTDASVSLARVNAWVNAERPSFLCDLSKEKKYTDPE